MLSLPDVVIFCPLPPKPNGIADYLAEQLRYFSQSLAVTVVIENHAPTPANICPRVKVIRMAEYLGAWDDFASVPHIYHVGNNPDTVYMLEVLLSRPGITVVHDLNLHYLIDLTNLSKGDKPAYEQALFNQYGVQGKVIGKQLSKYGWKGAFMPHELMMHSSIIDASAQIIVHSEYSANKIASLGHAKVHKIPHHLSPGIRQYQPKLKMTYRGQLGLPGNKVVITSMGFIAKAKQIKAVLNSLTELKRTGLEFVYVLAGQCKPHEYDVYQDIADAGLQDDVIVTGFLSEDQFFKYLLSSDFIINLRYPTGGESSGTLARAMGLGLGCIVVDIGPFAELPDDCAIKLRYDSDFQDNLTASIASLIEEPQKRVALGLNARKWVEATHEIATTTSQYQAVILAEQRRLSEVDTKYGREDVNSEPFEIYAYRTQQQVNNWLVSESAYLKSLNTAETGTLWFANNTVPVGNHNALLLSESPECLTILAGLYGYKRDSVSYIDAFSLESHPDSQVEKLHDIAVCVVNLRALEADPVRYLSKLNRHLKMGAAVVLNVLIDDKLQADVLLDRNHFINYCEASGFLVKAVHTGPKYIDMNLVAPDQQAEEWCFELTKASWMVNKTPDGYAKSALSELEWLQPAAPGYNGRGVL